MCNQVYSLLWSGFYRILVQVLWIGAACAAPRPDKSPAPQTYGAPAAAPAGYGAPQQPACTLQRVQQPTGKLTARGRKMYIIDKKCF